MRNVISMILFNLEVKFITIFGPISQDAKYFVSKCKC